MRRSTIVAALLAVGLQLAALPTAASQQPKAVRQVSLEEAIRLADRTAENVEVARAGVSRAIGQQRIARSQFLPQLNGQVAYSRTLASQFEGLSFGGGPDTASFRALCAPNVEPGATPAQRQAAIDASSSCTPLSQTGGGGGLDFQSVGFGALNSWTFGLQFSQALFTGGRATGQRRAAIAGRNVADMELTAQRAQLILDVTQMYYNTVLAARLSEIADAALTMSTDVLRQTTAARQVGSSSEFDLLRAQVARDNQVPVALARRSDRDIALLRLKQLLEIPLDDSLVLTTSIDAPPDTAVSPWPLALGQQPQADGQQPDTSVGGRAVVRQAQENVNAQEGLLRAARADRFPTISLTSGYQRLYFPNEPFDFSVQARENWTVGVSANVSLLSGGRTSGGVLMADASVREARARLKQARELAALDSRIALSQLAQAEATWRASQGTADMARRAYNIDQIRYREGISTQTELSNSQLLLEQAMVNRAVAARDLAVARMRLTLLKDLPLGAGGSAGGAAGAQMGGASQAMPAQPPQQPRTSAATATSGSIDR
jgi:outer membrane protein